MSEVVIAPGVNQIGDQDYLFGIDDPGALSIAGICGIRPQTISIDGEPEFTAEAKNLYGLTEAFVVANSKDNFTLDGYVVDKDKLNASTGKTFIMDGRKFIITNRSRNLANNDFQKGKVTGVSYPLIT